MHRNIILLMVFSIIISVFFTLPLSGQERLDYLRRENARLRAEVDSLSRVLQSFDDDAFSTWSGLTGMEDEDDFTSVFFGYSAPESAGERSELMAAIRRSAPSVASSWNEAIEQKVAAYTGVRRKSMPAILGRYELFLPLFRTTFAKYGVPEELIALCIVESAVSRRALSHAGAAGIWQIMPETGRRYGLRIDQNVDERYDPVAATDAAARLLRDLRKSLGRWDLAILAYNCGSARVRKAVMAASQSSDIWEIMKYLPNETKSYLPSFLAARYVVTDRSELGISVNRQKGFPKTKTLSLRADITIKQLSYDTGRSETVIRELNPKFVGDLIPAGELFELPENI